jgi:hypothetical protein
VVVEQEARAMSQDWFDAVEPYEEGDDDVVTAPEALDRLGSRIKAAGQYMSRIGVEPAATDRGRGRAKLFRYGDVRIAHQTLERENWREG